MGMSQGGLPAPLRRVLRAPAGLGGNPPGVYAGVNRGSQRFVSRFRAKHTKRTTRQTSPSASGSALVAGPVLRRRRSIFCGVLKLEVAVIGAKDLQFPHLIPHR